MNLDAEVRQPVKQRSNVGKLAPQTINSFGNDDVERLQIGVCNHLLKSGGFAALAPLMDLSI